MKYIADLREQFSGHKAEKNLLERQSKIDIFNNKYPNFFKYILDKYYSN
jgi:hypothetical protein